jgi:hypothetical protein
MRPRKPKKTAKKVAPVTILPTPAEVEVIRRGKKQRGAEETEV